MSAFSSRSAGTEQAVAPEIRVLFAAWGWPSGTLDVGSWIARRNLATVRIVQLPDPEDAGAPFTGNTPVADEDVLGPEMCRQLATFRPHVVGFRLMAGYLPALERAVAAVRKRSDAEIVVGGPTATSHPAEVLEAVGCDYVFAGEAEETFSQFLEFARRPGSRDLVPAIPGLAYRYGGRVYHNTLPRDGYGRSSLDVPVMNRRSADRDDVPPLSRACLQNVLRPVASRETVQANRLDFGLLVGFRRPFDSLFFTGGRGCPGRCAFCANLHGREVRAKTAEQLIDEIAAADRAVQEGRLQLERHRLFEFCRGSKRQNDLLAWAAIYDEDFFLARRRAIRFFELWAESELAARYRVSVQTNPCSLLDARGRVDPAVRRIVETVHPMIQLGAESFHPALLARWQKRHTASQLENVLDALETCGCDYTIFHLLTDFESTAEEVLDALYLLVRAAGRYRNMRIASNPFTLPLFDSATRRRLEFRSDWDSSRVRSFADYEREHPEWMDPLAAGLAETTSADLHWALYPPLRNNALADACAAALAYLREQAARRGTTTRKAQRLLAQAEWLVDRATELRFAGGVFG
ncbi:hypothetical protein JCM19992_01690 [Thermostilla marina]